MSQLYEINLIFIFKHMFFLVIIFIKNLIMKKVLSLIGYHIGLWGILGFFATLFFGFITCCANLPENTFYISLFLFALLGLTATVTCVIRGCHKNN